MRIQPRRQILDIWRSVIRSSYRDGNWTWRGRDESNSVSDAEQLFCLLYPATEVPALLLDNPDMIKDDVADALYRFGDPSTIPYRLIEVIEDYVSRNTVHGEPHFGGRGYLSTEEGEPTEQQLSLGLVESYSISVTLCLAALGFLREYKPPTRRAALVARIADLEGALSRRLTAALVGLLRSFVVNTVGTGRDDEPVRAAMLAMVNQDNEPDQVVIARLRERLQRVRARLVEGVRIGVSTDGDLEEESRLFEIGWGWGIVTTAPPVKLDLGQCAFEEEPSICTAEGVADPRPYLYSTVIALDGINDLRSQRTLELNLLDDEQRRLAEALRIRFDLTQRYWSSIARFGDTWPLEDIPWRTSDGDESDYYTLLVSAVLIQDMETREANDDDLDRAVDVLESLAQRGRITRRVVVDDPSVALHVPGVRMRLGGSDKRGETEIGPQLYWHARDFAPLLMKRCLQAAALSGNRGARDRLLALAKSTMRHLVGRRIENGAAAGLWDNPREAMRLDLPVAGQDEPSWHLTERVVEALVTATRTFEGEPVRHAAMRSRAEEVLHEAEHLLNKLLLETATDDASARSVRLTEIETKLNRAADVITERPGTANALALEALRGLDELVVARDNASRGV
ncbi:SCO2524 family protein [Actinokineospora guangxiensis]|uniref:SCO2524 family protein n=1 Tax=Actinokineospora guangxiensis TaxID=1490288 RepID=A0ABW0ETN6_9PSEU